ncbi:MAG: hypothetical protein ACLU7D_08945 [Collinsella sp.]
MELADFAAHTPFQQLPEIAAASRTLETLTDGALSTGQGLAMVGDVASGTNPPFGRARRDPLAACIPDWIQAVP